MRDEPQGSVDQREPMMDSVPGQRTHEDADGEERAVGVAPVPDGTEEDHDAWARRDESRPADTERGDTATADTATADTATADAATADTATADTGTADAERADAERADGRAAVDVELPEDAARREDVAAQEDVAARGDLAAQEDVAARGDDEDWAAREERTGDNGSAGGVPDDAVSSADAPVPAAAYQSADREAGDREAGDERAGEEAHGEEAHGELMPGDVPEQPVGALFDKAAADGFRDRWQRVQMQFVDDPRDAADQARSLVDDVLDALHDGLNNQRGALDGWQSGQPGDTEQLRVAIRRYRDFLDRMLGL